MMNFGNMQIENAPMIGFSGCILLLILERQTKQPKDENFWDMLHLNFCPRLKILTFTVAIIVIDIIVFSFTTS